MEYARDMKLVFAFREFLAFFFFSAIKSFYIKLKISSNGHHLIEMHRIGRAYNVNELGQIAAVTAFGGN